MCMSSPPKPPKPPPPLPLLPNVQAKPVTVDPAVSESKKNKAAAAGVYQLMVPPKSVNVPR